MTAAVAEPEGLVRRVFRDVLRSVTRKAQNQSGIMAALFLPPEVAAELAQPGGLPADQLHVTLKIFAPDAGAVEPEDLDELAAQISRAARDMHPLSGNVSGVGRFNGDQAGGGQDVIYATLDVDDLVDLYQRIAWVCLPDDDQGDDEHDWQPHVTLAYGNGLELPSVPSIPIRFDRLTLAVGGERREYLFAGADTVAAPAVAPELPLTAGPAAMTMKAARSAASLGKLPDSAFAIVKAGGTKDDAGLTTPRALRMLPYRDAAGAVDLPHLRSSLARVAQPEADLTDAERASAKAKLAAAAEASLAKALEDVGEAVAKAIGETGYLGELEVEAVGLTDAGVMLRAGGPTGQLYIAKDDGAGAFSSADLVPGGMLAPGQGVPRRRRPKSPAAAAAIAKAVDLDRYQVIKSEAEQRYSLGVAYPARRVGKADSQDVDAHAEYMTPDELEASAWRFMADGAKDSGLMHKAGTDGAGKVVESYIYRGPTWKVEDQIVEPGDWLLGVLWDQPSWDAIKSGKLTGYSLQGLAAREAV